MVRQIWRTRPPFFFKFCSQVVLVHFPPTTCWPLIGTHFPLPSQNATSAHHLIIPRHLYGLPHGTIRLVHESVQKHQNWVTCGSLWCFHVIMLTLAFHMSLPYSCHIYCMDADIICTDVDVSSTDADSSLVDWARLTKI
jgi:hypothetical protein